MRTFNYIWEIFKILVVTACTVLISMLSGCISPFEPVGVENRAGILVVEGMILETGTTIQLSRTIKTKDDISIATFDDVDNATIHIIDEGINVIAVAEQQIINGIRSQGVYEVRQDFSFIPGMKYALDMKIDGKQYRSSFVSPVHTPEIDDVNYQINEDNSIDIFVSTHSSENQTKYFRWAFEEDWELLSKFFMFYRYDPNSQKFSIFQSPDGDNRYYCWASDHSKSLILASSAKYTDDVIKNQKIHSFAPGTSRYSYLYSILVKQYGLENEAYLYFENLQRNLDESGSIFAPQPSEMTGNVQCLTNQEETVIGYVFASKMTTHRLYLNMSHLNLTFYEDQYDCLPPYLFIRNDASAFAMGLGKNGDELSNEYVSLRCLDCTYRGGTKTKPAFWPNDHQ